VAVEREHVEDGAGGQLRASRRPLQEPPKGSHDSTRGARALRWHVRGAENRRVNSHSRRQPPHPDSRGQQKFVLQPESENVFFTAERDLTFEFVKTGTKVSKIVVREHGAVVEEARPE
jgi:hypothetical protein